MPDVFLKVVAKQGHVNSSGFEILALTGSGIIISRRLNKRCRSLKQQIFFFLIDFLDGNYIPFLKEIK